MLLSGKKNIAPILYAMLFTLTLLVIAFKNTNVAEFKSDVQQSFLSTDPGFSKPQPLSHIVNSVFKIASGKIFGFSERPELNTLYIDIKPEEYRTLLNDREGALKNRILTNPSEVNAKIRFENKQLRANVRLKGDLIDHWLSKRRMSLRIELKNDASILEFNEFSLQKPESRQHPYDQTFQSLIRRTGSLSSSHNYVNVVLNGQAWGVMNMEESMTSEFLEKQDRKESLIVRFSDEEKGVMEMAASRKGIAPYAAYRLSDDSLFVKMYEQQKYGQRLNYRKWYSYISSQRLAQHTGRSELYNIDAYSKALFISAYWNDGHSLWHANSRHYFNPYLLQLEPITTDAYIPFSIRNYDSLYPRKTFDPLNNNSVYNYVISTNEFRTNLNANFDVAQEAILYAKTDYELNHRMFPLDPIDEVFLPTLADNIQLLDLQENREALFLPRKIPVDDYITPPSTDQLELLVDYVHIRHHENGKVDIFNLLPVPVTLNKIENLAAQQVAKHELNLVLPGYTAGTYEPLTIQTKFYGILDNAVTVETEYEGIIKTTHSGLTLNTNDMHNPLLNVYKGEHDFLQLNEAEDWQWKSGSWEISEPLVIEGNLKLLPGTEISFSENAYLIVHGRIQAEGSEDSKIVLNAQQSNWKGLYVYQAKQQSSLKHVNISDYSSLEDGLLSLTGGITFYQSDLVLENVQLSNVKAEDAINVVESHIEFSYLDIRDTQSDGLDSDFSNGFISNSQFLNINGDAIDFSGSVVDLDNIIAREVYDKAISVGESSTVTVSIGTFSNVGVGIVSKDGSTVFAEDLTIEPYLLSAAMAYEKKSFYPKPTLELRRIQAAGEMAFVRQTGSYMSLDEREVPERALDVDDLYANSVMSK